VGVWRERSFIYAELIELLLHACRPSLLT